VDFDLWIQCVIQICRLQVRRQHRRLIGESMATLAEQIKAARAQLVEARKQAADAVADSANVALSVLKEVEKTRKETDDLRAEMAELTNGGPAMDTPMPQVRGYPQ
jgi:isopropylmalate/homocitrate/citramalate synthase